MHSLVAIGMLTKKEQSKTLPSAFNSRNIQCLKVKCTMPQQPHQRELHPKIQPQFCWQLIMNPSKLCFNQIVMAPI